MSVCATLAKLKRICYFLSIVTERSAVELAALDSSGTLQLRRYLTRLWDALFHESEGSTGDASSGVWSGVRATWAELVRPSLPKWTGNRCQSSVGA